MTLRNGQRRRYRKVIVRSDHELQTVDLWPGDEVWDEKWMLLGTADASGFFQASPAISWN